MEALVWEGAKPGITKTLKCHTHVHVQTQTDAFRGLCGNIQKMDEKV